MLVLLSDLHFTDGTIGRFNVPPYAFDALAEYLKAILRRPGTDVQDVEVALLGDAFDILRSGEWRPGLGEEGGDPARPSPMPWHPPGPALEARVSQILDATLRTNAEALDRLTRLSDALGTEVSFSYLPGNHDRLLNHFAATRTTVAQALRIDHDPARPFPASALWHDYSVFAEHGDRHDALCSGAPGTTACIGDPFAILLMNGLLIHLRAELAGEGDPEARASLELAAEELDHVRPLWAAALWFERLVGGVQDPTLRAGLLRAWEAALEDFRSVCLAETGLGASADLLKLLQRKDLGRLTALRDDPMLGELLTRHKGAYAGAAIEACRTARPLVDFVVFGHTHAACRVPFRLEDGRLRMYINTGTWRHTINLVPTPDRETPLLVPWDEMSFVVIFREGECRGLTGSYRFETWQGTRA